MNKRVGSLALIIVFVLVLNVLVSCKSTSQGEQVTESQTVTSAEVSETVLQTDADELIPEDKPKNMDTSNSNVIIDASQENVQLRFRKDGTGILIGSMFVTFDEENRTFLMDDGREIKLISDKDAEVDGEPYTYSIMNFTDEERYIFYSETDEKQLTIFKSSYNNQLVVHLAFNYAMNEDMLAMDFDYKFYGKDAELYSAEYSIDDYRGTMQIGDTKFDYSDATNDYCLLSAPKSMRSYWLYDDHKGKMSHTCVPLTVIEEGKRFEYKDGAIDISITIVNDTEAEVNGELFDYEKRDRYDKIEIFSKDSKLSYDLYDLDNDLLPPSITINYEFNYTYDGSELAIDFGGILDNVVGRHDDNSNVIIIGQYEYSILGEIPSSHIK